jgi:hypothetical protein
MTFLATLPEQLELLQIAVVALLGHFAFFFEASPEYLPSILQKLFKDLLSPPLRNIASRSIQSVFRYCSRKPGLPIADLHSFLQQYQYSKEKENAVNAASASANGASAAVTAGKYNIVLILLFFSLFCYVMF